MASMLSLGPTLSIALVADAAQRGAPPANSDPESPPLHTAVRAGDARLVKSLIKRGADVRVRNRLGVAPLTIAAMRGDAAMLDILLDAGADPNMSFGAGESALMTAARVGIPEAVRVLIERGADVNATEGWLEETALMWAAAENHAEAMTALIEAGALVDARSAKTDFPEQKFDIEGMLTTYLPQGRWTPLMYAARQNAIDAARVLAKAGADLDAPDPDGTTALMIAIINAHFDLAAVLLEQGGSPNIADRTGMTALYAAVDMHTLDRTFGRPQPRFESAIDGVRLVKSLLERGADPNLPLWEPTIQRHHNAGNPFMGAGATPLVRAAKNGDIELVKMLLEHGADINVVLADGTNLVMAAATSGAGQFSRSGKDEAGVADVIRLGLGLGLDVDAVDQRGRTALHMAAGNGDDKVVRLLAERGAKLDVVDERGFTPLDLASGKGGRPSPRNMPKESTVALLQELMKSQRR